MCTVKGLLYVVVILMLLIFVSGVGFWVMSSYRSLSKSPDLWDVNMQRMLTKVSVR